MTTRTALTPSTLSVNGGLVSMLNDGTGMTATDATNGMSVAVTTTSIPANADLDRLLLIVLNTNGTGRTVTIRGASSDGGNAKTGAGAKTDWFANVPGFLGALGDVTSSAMTATTGIGVFGPFDTARFLQPDGTICIDFSGATGFIKAVFLPRAVY